VALLEEIGARRRVGPIEQPRPWGLKQLERAFSEPLARAAMLTAAFAVFRLASVPLVGLGVDESYTVAISRRWDLSYFDHPPLHQWIIAAFASLLGSGRWLRLPFVALSAATSLLLFFLTRRMFGARAAVWTTVVFNLAGFFTVAAGSWILPDGPLDLCLVAAALCLTGVLFPEPAAPATLAAAWRAWMGAGFWIGLAALSKYQAVLFGAGLVLFLATSRLHRKWLAHPAPWAAGILALVIFSPVLVWNAQHEWVSFRFQGGRGGALHAADPLAPLVAITGQAALLLPWVFVVLATALKNAVHAGPRLAKCWFFVLLAAPAIVLFTVEPLWGERALPHWSMPGWLMVMPLAGLHLAGAAWRRRWPRVWLIGSTIAIALIWPLALVEAATGALGKLAPSLRADPTVETVEWSNLRKLVSERLSTKSTNRRCLFVAATNWSEGGKVGDAVGDLVPVRVLSSDPRGFGFMKDSPDLTGCDALLVGRSDKMPGRIAALRPLFQSIRPLAGDVEGRGVPEVRLSVLDARGLLRPLPKPYPR
jgi:hypothetical protein